MFKMKFTANKFSNELKLDAISKNSHEDSLVGIKGVFTRVKNDFTFFDDEQLREQKQHFVEDPHWTSEKRQQVKKFRFRICSLALFAMTLGMMSRFVLNLAIVEMTKPSKKVGQEGHVAVAHNDSSSSMEDGIASTTQPTLDDIIQVNDEIYRSDEDEETLDWSIEYQNLLISAFYIGYAPSMLLSGNIAELHGSKYPLLIAILGSAIISLLTPLVARYSFTLLFFTRILLGVLQGGLMPSLYDLFNKWLTLTETSIFVPLVKVFAAFGAFTAAMLPGVASQLGLKWPAIFYTASSLCIVWALLWTLLATSTPQTNRFVKINECQWIMRKKQPFAPASPLTLDTNKLKLSNQNGSHRESSVQLDAKKSKATEPTPWLLIITNSSVLALTLVKFTYNVGMDFFFLEMALYLRKVHQASTETISAIASGGSLIQMTLITFVGWLARVLVDRRAFGLSRTKWRKIFQGSSNFTMALAYFALPFAGSNLPLVITLMVVAFLFWVFGAGGESMVPYDLSSRYPATICGLAHSFSVLSGIAIPALCGLVLSEDGADPRGWNLLFVIIGSGCTLGGLVFCLVLKSKPFLPGESDSRPNEAIQHG